MHACARSHRRQCLDRFYPMMFCPKIVEKREREGEMHKHSSVVSYLHAWPKKARGTRWAGWKSNRNALLDHVEVFPSLASIAFKVLCSSALNQALGVFQCAGNCWLMISHAAFTSCVHERGKIGKPVKLSFLGCKVFSAKSRFVSLGRALGWCM